MVSSTLTRFSTSLLYYGLSLNTGGFGLNLYLTQFIFGVVEIPAILSCLFLIQHFGRKIPQAGFLFFGGVTCFMVLVIPKGTFKTFAMIFFFILKKLLQRCNLSSVYLTYTMCSIDLPVVVTIIASLGKYFSTASLSTLYVYTTELYPTILR